jgi:hypothetical protein
MPPSLWWKSKPNKYEEEAGGSNAFLFYIIFLLSDAKPKFKPSPRHVYNF